MVIIKSRLVLLLLFQNFLWTVPPPSFLLARRGRERGSWDGLLPLPRSWYDTLLGAHLNYISAFYCSDILVWVSCILWPRSLLWVFDILTLNPLIWILGPTTCHCGLHTMLASSFWLSTICQAAHLPAPLLSAFFSSPFFTLCIWWFLQTRTLACLAEETQ
jgi:hypothetical protein